MINDLKQLIAINSVSGDASAGAPFGSGPRAALDWFLNKAAEYGLATGEDDGYCGWAEYGEGTLVAALAHLDIVPAGEGWSTDPFTLTAKNGNLYGRGAIDDKGAAVAALHALKSLKDAAGAVPKGRIRLIVGCNEESGSACMKHYAKHCELPAAAFTPDAEFPVINSEKGIAHLSIEFAREQTLADNFEYIRGGSRPNIVPNRAECKITGKLAVKLADPAYTIDRCVSRDRLTVSAAGTAAHGSTPEKGDNALRKLFSFISAVADSPAAGFIAEYLAPKDAAERLSIACSDEKSGRLTINLGMVEFDRGRLTATIDVRMPVSMTFDVLCGRISEKLPEGARLIKRHYEPNLYVDPESGLITTLLAVYEKHFGKKGRPLQIGGGTYAKTLPNCVAFGPGEYGADYHMHDADEYIPERLLYKLVDVYKDAMLALCEMVNKQS